MERTAPGLKRLPGRLDGAAGPGLAPPPADALPRPRGATARPRPGTPAAIPADAPAAGRSGASAPARVLRPPGPGTPLRLGAELRRALKPRHRGPHPAGTIDVVRRLYETTTLPYRAIAARTGVSIATIARQARRGFWLRPETGFGEEHYTPEGRRRLRRQALAERLLTLAERQVDLAALDPHASPRALEKALRFVRAARGMEE